MPLKLIADSLDEVPESLRDQAKEVEGKFELDGTGLVKKNTELLTKVATIKPLKEKLAKFGDIDPDDAKEALEKVAELEKNPAAKPPNIEEIQAKWTKEKEKEFAPIKGENEKLKGELLQLKLTDKVKAIAIKSGVKAKYVDDLMAVTGQHYKLGEKDQIIILDSEGDPMDKTPEQFFGEVLKEQKPIFFEPSGAAGSGAQPGTSGKPGSTTTIKRADFEQMAPAGRAAHISAGGAIVD